MTPTNSVGRVKINDGIGKSKSDIVEMKIWNEKETGEVGNIDMKRVAGTCQEQHLSTLTRKSNSITRGEIIGNRPVVTKRKYGQTVKDKWKFQEPNYKPEDLLRLILAP